MQLWFAVLLWIPDLKQIREALPQGVYFGEVPLAGLAAQHGSADLKMIDLERVEVLRGPQGTLFGSSSLAGAVRNIPNAPNTEELEGNIKTGYSNTAEFGGSNTKVEGVINIPLIDDILAIRAVAYRHDTSGYIKNIAGTQLATNGSATPFYNAADAVATYGGAELYRDEDDVGNATHTGGRIAVLWKPTDKLDVTLQYVTQDVEQEGIPYVQLNTGGYTQVVQQIGNNVAALSGKELGLKDDISIINLVAEYDLGWATLLSSSAWMEEDGERNADFSWALGGSPIVQPLESSSDIFTQELRLVSSLDGPFQYIAGVYYEDVEYFESTPFYATGDLALSLIVNPVDSTNPLIFDQVVNRPLEQLAFFGEVSYDISDQLTFTGGLRRFDYERSQHVVSSGAFGNSDDSSIFDEAGTSFKANLSYAPNEDTLVYAQWAEGFRLGNAVIPPPATLCDVNNDGILDGTNTPIKDSFDSDSTESIELGVKLALLDNRLQINAAVYRIDWQNIPLSVAAGQLPSQPAQTCFSAVTANAGDARSQGFEIETTYQMTENLQLSLGGAYTNAELTGIASGVSFSTGDRLPSFPDYNLNLGLQYEFELGRNPSYLQADFAYVSEYFSTPGAERDSGPGLAPAAGDYGVLNMSAGIGLDQFNIELFAHNLTNEDALTLVGRFAAQGEAWRLRPRTIGLTVGYKF